MASVLLYAGWAASLASTITGVVLMWDSREDLRTTLDTDSARYGVCIFVFAWIASALASHFKHNMLLMISSGLLVALLIRVVTLEELDNMRLLINRDDSLRQALNISKDTLEKTAGGAVLAYIGVCLAFILQTFGQTRISDTGATVKTILSAIVVLVCEFIGCIILWAVDFIEVNTIADFGKDLRKRVFHITDIGVVVGYIAIVGYLSRNYSIISAGAAFSAGLGITLLMELFETDTLITGSSDDKNFRTGAGLVYIGLMLNIFLAIWCTLEAGKNINLV